MTRLREGGTYHDWLVARKRQLVAGAQMRDEGKDPRVFVDCGIAELAAHGVPERGFVTVLAGHSGDSKSSLALRFLEGAAKQGYLAMGHLYEDPAEFVADRGFSAAISESSLDLRLLRVKKRNKVLVAPELDELLTKALDEMAWSKNIRLYSKRLTPEAMLATLSDDVAESIAPPALFVFDYLQILTDEGTNPTQAVSRVMWELNERSKPGEICDEGMAVVPLSQVDTAKVMEQGERQLNSWKFANKNQQPDRAAIDGYRPRSGHLAWGKQAIQARMRDAWVTFRPNRWLRDICGVQVPDNVLELHRLKTNYGEGIKPIVLGWDGKTTSITTKPAMVDERDEL